MVTVLSPKIKILTVSDIWDDRLTLYLLLLRTESLKPTDGNDADDVLFLSIQFFPGSPPYPTGHTPNLSLNLPFTTFYRHLQTASLSLSDSVRP